jgi:hypothetical protein
MVARTNFLSIYSSSVSHIGSWRPQIMALYAAIAISKPGWAVNVWLTTQLRLRNCVIKGHRGMPADDRQAAPVDDSYARNNEITQVRFMKQMIIFA